MKAKKTEAARVARKPAVSAEPPRWPLFAGDCGRADRRALGLRAIDARALSLRRHHVAIRSARVRRTAARLGGTPPPAADVHLLGECADLGRRSILLSCGECLDPPRGGRFDLLHRAAAGGVGRRRGGMRTPLAGFCALLFLLHPVETEAVAYLAGRSEVLELDDGVRGLRGVSLPQAGRHYMGKVGGGDVLFVAALASKEQTIVLPALLVAHRLLVEPRLFLQGIRQNWRLYVPLALGAVVGRSTLRAAHFQRADGRLRHEGSDVVSVSVHRIPRHFRLHPRVLSAVRAQRRLGFSDFAFASSIAAQSSG